MKNNPVKLRFAPSPTGYLHVGNMRTFLVNWLFAKKEGGQVWLRFDDTDTERSRPEFEASIKEDLEWLGLVWDEAVKQSERLKSYEAARVKLVAAGRLYACYETAEELEIKRKMLASRGLPPLYDRSALSVSDEQKKAYEAQGRRPHWRFLLNDGEMAWDDLVRGHTHFSAQHVSDPVLIREDGVPLYTIASVVDDGEMGITHVIRGEDHVTNTAVQIQIFEALGFTPPVFAHLALLKTKDGELSKRKGGNDIRSLREEGIEPMAINSYLAKIGTSDAVEAFQTLGELAATLDFGKFGRAPANYDEAELERLNEKLLTHMPYAVAEPKLRAMGLMTIDEPFWNSVHGNLKHMFDIKDWWETVHGEISTAANDADFARQAAQLLPAEPWSIDTWNQWTQALKEVSGRKGKELFLPLRLALTGKEHGPEMKALLPLLGREKVQKRLGASA